MRWWLPVLLAVAVVAAGACARPCDASSCTGCCDSSGECLVGTRRTACGLGGVACARCPTGDVCQAGLCFAPDPDAGVADAGSGRCACATSCCLPDGRCAANNVPETCGLAKTWCVACEAFERCEQGACVPESCGGCLDPVGSCQPGTWPSACGQNGAVCRACASDETCTAGACTKVRCDETNCRFGCCLPDRTCVTTPSDSACGTSGTACSTCDGGTSCVAGGCR